MKKKKKSKLKLVKTVKLLPTSEQYGLIQHIVQEYRDTLNRTLTEMIDYDQHFRFSSKLISGDLPSCVKNELAGDALAMDEKMFKYHISQPVVKKRYASWNNQNYQISKEDDDYYISFPVRKDGKSMRIRVKAIASDEVFAFLDTHKLGSMKIKFSKHKILAKIAYEPIKEKCSSSGVMGVDLGLKCPAVAITDTGKVQFFGNGRKNKRIRRHFSAKRKKLQKKKKLNAVRKLENKEARIMKDIDHKISREIVNFAYANGIKMIKLEDLSGISHSATSKSRNKTHKAESFSWSFYRLKQFITYKAELLGIKVSLIDPYNTSKICPNCGQINKAKDRLYVCDCGYTGHRDLVGAKNILAAPIN